MFKKFVIFMAAIAILSVTIACGKTVSQVVKAGQALVGVAGEAYKDAKENLETAKEALKESSEEASE